MKQFAHLGFNNWLNVTEIAVVQLPNSAPAVRSVQEARKRNTLVDVTQGRKTKSIIVLKSGLYVLSALAPDTIIGRIEGIGQLSATEEN